MTTLYLVYESDAENSFFNPLTIVDSEEKAKSIAEEFDPNLQYVTLELNQPVLFSYQVFIDYQREEKIKIFKVVDSRRGVDLVGRGVLINGIDVNKTVINQKQEILNKAKEILENYIKLANIFDSEKDAVKIQLKFLDDYLKQKYETGVGRGASEGNTDGK